MHWRHVSITTTPCWGSRLIALHARVVLEARWRSRPLSQCAGPGRPGGMACRGWPAGFMLGDGARGSASFDPQHAGAPFCDVICIRSIHNINANKKAEFNFSCLNSYKSTKTIHLNNSLSSTIWVWLSIPNRYRKTPFE